MSARPRTKAEPEQKVACGQPLIPQLIKIFGAMALFYSAELLNAAGINYIQQKFAAKKEVVTKRNVSTPHQILNPIVSILGAALNIKSEEEKFRSLTSKHSHLYNEIAAGNVFKNLDKYEETLLKNPTNETVKTVFGNVWNTILSKTEIKRVENYTFLFIPDEEGAGGDIVDFLSRLKVTLKRKKVDAHYIWDFFPSTAAAKEHLVAAVVAYCLMEGAEGEVKGRNFQKFSSNIMDFLKFLREDLLLNEKKIRKTHSLLENAAATDMSDEELKKIDAAGDKFWLDVITTWNQQHPDYPARAEKIEVTPNGMVMIDLGGYAHHKLLRDKQKGFKRLSKDEGEKVKAVPKLEEEFRDLVFKKKVEYKLRRVPQSPRTNIKERLETKEKRENIEANFQMGAIAKLEMRYDLLLITLFNSVVGIVSKIMAENKDEKGAASIEKLKLSAKAQNVDVVKTVEKAIEQNES